jgi:hypothetical protein
MRGIARAGGGRVNLRIRGKLHASAALGAALTAHVVFNYKWQEEAAVSRVEFIWDLEDDPDGNYWHICVEGHGVTREEVEEVVTANYELATRSRSCGQPQAFGWSASGKYITVVFEKVSADPLTVCPITAYEVPPPGRRTRRKRR